MSIVLQALNQSITGEADQTEFYITLAATGGEEPTDGYTYVVTKPPVNGLLEEYPEVPDLLYTANASFYGRDEFIFTVEDDDDVITTGRIRVIVVIEPTIGMITDLRVAINDIQEAFSEILLSSIISDAMTRAYGPRSTKLLSMYECYKLLLSDAALRTDWRQFEIQQDDSDLFDHIKDMLDLIKAEYNEAVEDELATELRGNAVGLYKALTFDDPPRYVRNF